jgi:hypothetical protein
MKKKLFRSWRKERLLKMKEQKEAQRKEAESATNFSTPVQSKDGVVALETKSKPRTVLLEEGEDDTAMYAYNTADSDVVPKYDIVFFSIKGALLLKRFKYYTQPLHNEDAHSCSAVQ